MIKNADRCSQGLGENLEKGNRTTVLRQDSLSKHPFELITSTEETLQSKPVARSRIA